MQICEPGGRRLARALTNWTNVNCQGGRSAVCSLSTEVGVNSYLLVLPVAHYVAYIVL
jgi:hypothetical protein